MTSEAWFESWFDSPLYEKLYANRDDTEAARLVGWIARRLPPRHYPEVLDMGCGRGRHAILLARHGYNVTGVDLSGQAIRIARQKASEEGYTNVTFETGDMRDWCRGPYDMVCSLFTSFGYFENDRDNLGVIRNITANVKPGGFLVMDFLNPGYVQNNLVPEEEVEVEGMQCRMRRRIEENTIIKSILFDSPETGARLQYQERVRLYDVDWFDRSFKASGLEMVDKRGGYSGEAYDPETSPRMLMVAEKGKARE